MSDHIYIAQGVGNLFGAGLVGLGLYAHVDPLYRAKRFGIEAANSQTSVGFEAIAGRDICLGLTILTLSWQGQRKAVGTVFACAVVAGVSDAWTCWQHGSESSWRRHAIGSVISGALGWMLLQ